MARVTSTVGKASRPDVWLQSVACASARACTAVGVFDANRLALSLGNGVPVAERWNGRQWRYSGCLTFRTASPTNSVADGQVVAHAPTAMHAVIDVQDRPLMEPPAAGLK